ncbi:MAG: glycosyl transferase [Burkholderiaceae bacterium]
MTDVLLPALAAFVATLGSLTLGLRSRALRGALADRPNERSLHKQVTPRFGGLGLLVGVAVGTSVALLVDAHGSMGGGTTTDGRIGASMSTMLGRHWPLAWLAAYGVLALGSVIDDRRPLPAWVRMLMHVVVAAVWVASARSSTGLGLPLAWAILTVIGMTWAMNLYNFMDGADGLAGGMALFGFVTLAIAAMMGPAAMDPAGMASHAVDGATASAEAGDLARTAAVLAAAAAGFLCLNFPPARLFMGDAGSIPLGFSAAALGLHGWQLGLWSPLFPIIVFFPFCFDATLTLLARLLRGERIWEPHRQHLYQRAVLSGLGHRAMTLRAYGLMAVCAVVALIGRNFAIGVETLIIAIQLTAGWALAARVARMDARERDRS